MGSLPKKKLQITSSQILRIFYLFFWQTEIGSYVARGKVFEEEPSRREGSVLTCVSSSTAGYTGHRISGALLSKEHLGSKSKASITSIRSKNPNRSRKAASAALSSLRSEKLKLSERWCPLKKKWASRIDGDGGHRFNYPPYAERPERNNQRHYNYGYLI